MEYIQTAKTKECCSLYNNFKMKLGLEAIQTVDYNQKEYCFHHKSPVNKITPSKQEWSIRNPLQFMKEIISYVTLCFDAIWPVHCRKNNIICDQHVQ